jgi:hypothetical protein
LGVRIGSLGSFLPGVVPNPGGLGVLIGSPGMRRPGAPLGAIIRKGQNAALTPEQEATLTAVVGIEDAIRANRERQNELFAAIDADEDYDITQGWVEPAP